MSEIKRIDDLILIEIGLLEDSLEQHRQVILNLEHTIRKLNSISHQAKELENYIEVINGD